MKKIMFVLAFAGVGLFANASTGKPVKININTGVEKKVKNLLPADPCQIRSTASDASGNVYWDRVIWYNCATGERIGAFDIITGTWIDYN